MTEESERPSGEKKDRSMGWTPTGAPKMNLTRTIIHGNGGKIFIPGSDGAMLTEISKMIDRATSMVLLSSFLLQGSRVTESINAAVDRGVDVFILTGNEDELKKEGDEYDIREDKKVQIKERKELLASLAGKALVRTSPDFHAKYVLIDPNTRSQQGLFMTCNATVGALSGNNIELCAKLEGDEVRSYFNHFVHGFWLVSNHEMLAKNIQPVPTISEDKLRRVLPEKIGMPCTSKGINDLREKVREIIVGAERSITLCAWSFDEGMEWQDDALTALMNGNEVTVLCRCDDRNLKALDPLARAGAKVMGFVDPPMHAKVVINESAGVIMSSNMTRLGLDSGFEISYILSASDVRAMGVIIEGWIAHCPMGLVPIVGHDPKDGSRSSEKDNGSDTVGNASPLPECEQVSSNPSSPTKKSDVPRPSKMVSSGDETGGGTVIMRLPRDCQPSGMEEGYDIFLSKDGHQRFLVVDRYDEVPVVRALAMKKGYTLALRRNDDN